MGVILFSLIGVALIFLINGLWLYAVIIVVGIMLFIAAAAIGSALEDRRDARKYARR